MLRLTDMTLSCISAYRPDAEQLKRLYSLLCSLGTDYIEMPAAAYEVICPENPQKIVLRLSSPGEASDYPEITRFVCRMNGMASSASVTREIQMNDVKEIGHLGQPDLPGNIRLIGLDDIFSHDYAAAFSKIISHVGVRIEFCPENAHFCATAAALEWAAAGGSDIVASFGGLGGKAALEEVLLSLRVTRRYRPTASYSVLPDIAALVEEMTGARFPDRKAVIGRTIFNVESGIHVDGILKKPLMYEPFPPELVGSLRRFIIGKHSGRKSVSAKLRELGYSSSRFDITRILSAVREVSIGKTASLTDAEFETIALKNLL